MDLMTDDIGSEIPISPPLSRSDRPEPQDKPLHVTNQREQLPVWDVSDDSAESHNSTSASASSAEQETNTDLNLGVHERMIKKWRAIKIADKQRAQKKVYRTDDVFTKSFGKNYSKFYEAFQQGISNPETRQTVATTIPAKRHSAAPSNQASKRRRQDDLASLPQVEQHQSPIISAQPSAATVDKSSTAPNVTEVTSPSSEVLESPVRPTPRSDSAAKGRFTSIINLLRILPALSVLFVADRVKSLTANALIELSSKRKGVGLYAGNWEYVTDEEKVPEYLSVAEKIADVEGRTTRRAYAKLTSKESVRDTGSLIRSSFKNQVRKSGRARNAVDYARLSTTEDNNHEDPRREPLHQSDVSPTRASNQASPSTSAPSTSDRSTLLPNADSRSTSTSTATNTENPERPKQSWNAIVYEVLATADGPLTFTQLMQGIRNLYPFFKASSQEKVLKSGLKNPLYFHEAFIKGDIINGKQTWGLKPGQFLDKKTGEVLTPQPRNPIRSTRPSPQVQEVEDPTPVDLTPKASHSHRPRTSNPRFGREILNPPEIPDSQDPIPATSSPPGAVSRIAAEQGVRFEEPTGAQRIADVSNDTLPSASPEVSVSVQASQPNSLGSAATVSPVKSTSSSTIAAAAEEMDIRNIIAPNDRETSAKSAHSFNALQAAQPRAASIPSSIDENETRNDPAATFQVASTPIPPAHPVSPNHVPARNADGDARSQTPEIIPATLEPSITYLPDTQLGILSQDGKAGAKENTNEHMPRWG